MRWYDVWWETEVSWGCILQVLEQQWKQKCQQEERWEAEKQRGVANKPRLKIKWNIKKKKIQPKTRQKKQRPSGANLKQIVRWYIYI